MSDQISSETMRKPREMAHSRSEEHTSELQSRQYLVCRLLLEKKKKPDQIHNRCSGAFLLSMNDPSSDTRRAAQVARLPCARHRAVDQTRDDHDTPGYGTYTY